MNIWRETSAVSSNINKLAKPWKFYVLENYRLNETNLLGRLDGTGGGTYGNGGEEDVGSGDRPKLVRDEGVVVVHIPMESCLLWLPAIVGCGNGRGIGGREVCCIVVALSGGNGIGGRVLEVLLVLLVLGFCWSIPLDGRCDLEASPFCPEEGLGELRLSELLLIAIIKRDNEMTSYH